MKINSLKSRKVEIRQFLERRFDWIVVVIITLIILVVLFFF